MSKVIIIAEAGVNHNGSLDLAKRMADAAKAAGADFVKYQTAVPHLVMSSSAPKAQYQLKNTDPGESQLEMARKIHLPLSDYRELKDYCESAVGIRFLSTPFDHESIELLNDIGMGTWKVPSGEVTNMPYLERIGSFGKEVIISTGMCDLSEVKRAISTVNAAGTPIDKIIVLHCTSDYPAKFNELNLRAISTLANETGCCVGYSDHSPGIEASIAAVALGAVVIEKHFTLDHNMEGPDHIASLEPDELSSLVKAIRNIQLALGDGMKVVTLGELSTRDIARKSIHAARRIKSGDIITSVDLVMKRPGVGISPYEMHQVIGKTALRTIEADSMIHSIDFA